MTGTGGRRASSVAGIAIASLAMLALGGCAGGLPDVHSITSLTPFGDSPAKDKPKADQPVNTADLVQPSPLGDVGIGKTNAPVTIIEYVSLGCASCPGFHNDSLPKLKKAYIDKGKVHYIVRDFPEDPNSTAMAQAARCVPAKDYLKAVDKFLQHQKEWASGEIKKDTLYSLVKFTGVKRDKFEACLADQNVANGLASTKERGRSFGVTISPTFFVNGKKVAGAVSYEELQGTIEAALVTPTAPQTPAGAPQAQQPAPQKAAPKST
jgi:protein-disulfide isomerase